MQVEMSERVVRRDHPDLWVAMDESGTWSVFDRKPYPGGDPGEGLWMVEVDESMVQECAQTVPRLLSCLLHASVFPEGVRVDWKRSLVRLSGMSLDMAPVGQDPGVEQAVTKAMAPLLAAMAEREKEWASRDHGPGLRTGKDTEATTSGSSPKGRAGK
jgi:hypothetical protein